MSDRRLIALSLLLIAPGPLAGCVAGVVETPAAPIYSQASPYAPHAYADPAHGPAQGNASAPTSGYCAEAMEVAQDAAARAATTGSSRDVGRAARTARYVRRDC